MKAEGGDDAANPEFDERRMLRIDAKVATLDVRNPGDNVVGLVDGEAIEARADRRMKNSSAGDQNNDEQKDGNVRFGIFFRPVRGRSYEASSARRPQDLCGIVTRPREIGDEWDFQCLMDAVVAGSDCWTDGR